MFGHQDDHNDDSQQPQHDGVLEHDDNLHPNDNGHVNPAMPNDADNFGAPSDDAPTDSGGDTPNPALPTDNNTFAPSDTPAPSDDHDAPSAPTVDAGTNDLLDIKTQALQQLTPLVDHLDQSPEEKFRTTMMMIQASDDQSLVKAAYEAAKDITDEKTKAQALLDIVNEINYFTHQGTSD